jgi:hypothetical protein
VKFRGANFLVRAAADFARNEILPVAMDVPSDQNELTDEYRFGRAQTADARAVIGELGRELGAEIAGVVLTSTMFGSYNLRRQAPSLRGFDYGAIGAPLLFVHHREDGCEHTPYAAAARLAGGRYALVSIAAWMLHRPFPKDIE